MDPKSNIELFHFYFNIARLRYLSIIHVVWTPLGFSDGRKMILSNCDHILRALHCCVWFHCDLRILVLITHQLLLGFCFVRKYFLTKPWSHTEICVPGHLFGEILWWCKRWENYRVRTIKTWKNGEKSSLVLSLKQHLFLSRIKRSKKVNWLQFLCVIGIIGQVCTKFMDPT